MSIIKINHLKKKFGTYYALKEVNLVLENAKHYAIKGSSGSGKSTLLYLLGGLDRPCDGQISVEGEDLFKMNDKDLSLYRNRYVGFVFQFHFLLSSLTCLDNILLPARIGNIPAEDIMEHVLTLAKYLKIDHCLEKFPPELSGGEQQRINIIRALSLKPKLLLCDEPTGNLDSENSKLVTNLLKTLANEFGSTLVIVTHDDNVSSQFENLIIMKDGTIVEDLPNIPTQ